MVLHFLPCQLLWAKYCLGCHHANNLPGAAVFLPAGFFFQSRGNYYRIKLRPFCTGDYELFDKNKCCGHGSVSMSWIWPFWAPFPPEVFVFPLSCYHFSCSWTESQKPRQRVSNADRKVFANPESFCGKFIIGWRISGNFAIQNIQIICKVSGWTGKFPDNLKSFRII